MQSRMLNTSDETQEDLPPMPASRFFARRRIFVSLLERGAFAAVALILCGTIFAAHVSATANPVPFVDIVSPVSINPGAAGVTLTVRGVGFGSTSMVQWNGTPLTT